MEEHTYSVDLENIAYVTIMQELMYNHNIHIDKT